MSFSPTAPVAAIEEDTAFEAAVDELSAATFEKVCEVSTCTQDRSWYDSGFAWARTVPRSIAVEVTVAAERDEADGVTEPSHLTSTPLRGTPRL